MIKARRAFFPEIEAERAAAIQNTIRVLFVFEQ
jgi:hypothetical protein